MEANIISSFKLSGVYKKNFFRPYILNCSDTRMKSTNAYSPEDHVVPQTVIFHSTRDISRILTENTEGLKVCTRFG